MTRAVNEFVRDVAHLCPGAYSALSTELQHQSTEFLRVTHEEAKSKLAAIVEVEQWKQVEVAPEFQQIVDGFCLNQVRWGHATNHTAVNRHDLLLLLFLGACAGRVRNSSVA